MQRAATVGQQRTVAVASEFAHSRPSRRGHNDAFRISLKRVYTNRGDTNNQNRRRVWGFEGLASNHAFFGFHRCNR